MPYWDSTEFPLRQRSSLDTFGPCLGITAGSKGIQNSDSRTHFLHFLKSLGVFLRQWGLVFLQLPDEEKIMLFEKKASAWYQVTYHPLWLGKSRELKGSGWEHGAYAA